MTLSHSVPLEHAMLLFSLAMLAALAVAAGGLSWLWRIGFRLGAALAPLAGGLVALVLLARVLAG